MLKRIVPHPLFGDVLYIKRMGCRRLRVLISPRKGIRVSVPFMTGFGEAVKFIEENSSRIMASLERLRHKSATGKIAINTQEDNGNLTEIRKRAKAILPARALELSENMNRKFKIADETGKINHNPFSFNRIAIKNNRTNWGSCSSKRNINLNMHLVNLPQELMDFVILHELCHLVYPNHGKEFHALLNAACNGKEKLFNSKLREYRLQ